MTDLFLLSGAVEHDPRVDAWLDSTHDEIRRLAKPWFQRLRDCGPNVRELMHDGYPTACVNDAAFAYVNAFKAHVNVGFYQGAALADPKRLLQGDGKRMRHVKVKWGEAVDAPALEALIGEAYADMRRRLQLS